MIPTLGKPYLHGIYLHRLAEQISYTNNLILGGLGNVYIPYFHSLHLKFKVTLPLKLSTVRRNKVPLIAVELIHPNMLAACWW